MSFQQLLAAISLTACAAVAQAAPSAVAQYGFNGTFASSVAGAPSLTATDPLGLSGFRTDTVFGNSQTVYNFTGTAANASQAGLTLNTTGLLTSNAVYSLEMVFKFTERQGAWRRVADVSSRSSDNGFYVSPSDTLYVYPTGGGAPFTNNEYHDVFLVANNGSVTFYLDGSAQATVNTTVMNIDASNSINFFLDNVLGGGQQEYSSGSIALVRLYNEALVAVPPLPPAVPEPATVLLFCAGLGTLAVTARRRRAVL